MSDLSREADGASMTARRASAPAAQVAGFVLIIALLGLDAWVGLRGASAVETELAAVDRRRSAGAALIDDVMEQQQTLRALEAALPAGSDTGRMPAELQDLAAIRFALQKLFARASQQALDAGAWRDAEGASNELTLAIDRVIRLPHRNAADLAQLRTLHDRLASSTARLIQASRAGSDSTRLQIDETLRRQAIQDRLLLSGCLFVACLFLWTATRTHRLLNEQSEELNRVSWQLLDKQETLARRLSRELHDELGQSLTALKTNFFRHQSSACVDKAWLEDCNELLRDSIRNAHEISQLLRPTVLDDFGLDSALSWLCERFEERNRIQVRYISDFHGRLEGQTETHVFRIAQEALTNVARHAAATVVRVTLHHQGAPASDDGRLSLEISDNGVGLPQPVRIPLDSLGLTGMKARARSMQGEMQIESRPGRGATLRLTIPLRDASHEKEDPNSAG
ncbi:MAG TPA: sensor histidine kinase [Bryobacteraceae bacterium]|nr:sensor histidine kinase [Bryobacteraceae bacterium]